MIIMAIDGACRRNGKPDCASMGVAFVKQDDNFHTKHYGEAKSTNQRGEMNGLVVGTDMCFTIAQESDDEDVYIITDSEYLFNAVSKRWFVGWQFKGWKTATGGDVKNQDKWEVIAKTCAEYEEAGFNIVPFHVKGHLFSIGAVTAAKIIEADPTGEFLYRTLRSKIISEWDSKKESIDAALELYKRNNGHEPPHDSFMEMVICNTVADTMAGYYMDKLDPVLRG